MTPLLRPLLIVLVGLLACSSASPTASAATRQATSVGGWTASVATVKPDPTIGTALRVRLGARAWSRPGTVQQRRAASNRPSRRPTSRPSRLASRLAHGVLARVNRLRRRGIRCGRTWQPPVPRVRHNRRLAAASRTYARRMAVHRFFSHTDRVTGKRSGWRASRAGYRWATVGENLAAGLATPAAVIRAWRRSAPHCRNMMDRRWKHLGVGWFHGPRSRWGTYWTQMFGAPL